MAGVSLQSIWNWRHMPHRQFPQPVARLKMGDVWDRAEVVKWLKANGYDIRKD
jgi:predicted DNA-binding transcriptional regulator AlpA